MLEAVGIGDLHLDGKLATSIADFNRVITDEVRIVLEKARMHGVRVVFLYGDVCERSRLSQNAEGHLLQLFHDYSEMQFIIWKGNHDTEGPGPLEPTSLDTFYRLAQLKYVPNIRVVLHEPTEFFTSTDHPIRVLPWPYKETKKGYLNLLHLECAGSKWETGREVSSTWSTKHLCASGHLHTAQQVGNMYFSGTLYQTTFGEDPDKFFHRIRWTGDQATSKIQLVRHLPKYLLRNAVVRSLEEYETLVAEVKAAPKTTLWKVFVQSNKVLLPVNAFDGLDTIIKTNPFNTNKELAALIQDDLVLDDNSAQAAQNTDEMLRLWFQRNQIGDDMVERATRKMTELRERGLHKA